MKIVRFNTCKFQELFWPSCVSVVKIKFQQRDVIWKLSIFLQVFELVLMYKQSIITSLEMIDEEVKKIFLNKVLSICLKLTILFFFCSFSFFKVKLLIIDLLIFFLKNLLKDQTKI